MSARILCISFSEIAADSRVLRQLRVLSEFGEVTTVGYGEAPDGAARHLRIDSSLPSLPQTPSGVANLALHRYGPVLLAAPAMRRALDLLDAEAERSASGGAATGFDLVVANEARALPLAHHVAAGTTPVWCDLHEWAPEERAHVTSWRLLIKPFMYHVCARYLPVTDAVTAVNGSIARLYEERFGCPQVEVVRNAAAYQPLSPSPMVPGRIRLAHSGAAVPGRNLEGMIDAVLALGEEYSLDLYLVKARDGGRYWARLKQLAAGSERITFHDAVAPDRLAPTLNRYDLGIFSLPPQTTNHRLMLPNKFFDFVQARLGVVFSPSPETTRLIDAHGLGAVAEDASSSALTSAIASLTREEIAGFKANAHAAARPLGSAADEDAERAVLRRLLPTPSR